MTRVLSNPTDTPELSTHIRYLEYVHDGTRSITLQYKNRVDKNNVITRKQFASRVKLATLTYQSLQEEMEKVGQTHEYARVCSAWVAIKSYYLLFYLETMIMALIEAKPENLKVSHIKLRSFIRNQLKSGALVSDFIGINTICEHSVYADFKLSSGSNLRMNLSEDDRRKLLMKKLTNYAKEEYKRSRNLKQLRSDHKDIFMKQDISLMDFFYWYRIKSNYRDLEFIAGEEASEDDLFYFYEKFNMSALGVANAYMDLINFLYTKRTSDSQSLISP